MSSCRFRSGFDALEARLAALEAKPTLKDAGVWQTGQTYEAGAVVSHGGSGWICHTTHVAGQQLSHHCFRLLVERGKDGRNAPHE